MQKQAITSRFELALWGREALAGLVVSVVQIAQAASYVALIFQGAALSGAGIGLWATLLGIAIVGLAIGYGTTMPPLAAGPDTPTLAVSTALAAGIAAQAVATGHGGESAAVQILMALTFATLIGGALMFGLGGLALAQSLRFIPYAVVAGFLAATGLLVALGGLKVLAGGPLSRALVALTWPDPSLVRLAAGGAFAAVLVLLRFVTASPLLIPGLVIAVSIAIGVATGTSLGRDSWYLPAGVGLASWNPLAVAAQAAIDWPLLLRQVPEITAVIIVTIVSLVVKIATIEFNRGQPVDFNQEFVSHGLGNLAAAPFGGLSMSVLLSATRLARDAGGSSYRTAVASAAVIAVVLGARIDVLSLIPIPVLGGLLVALGWGLVADALRGPWQQRAWLELGIAAVIMLACLSQGYILGVLAGLAASCFIFAINYSRVGVVHRHLTRTEFSGSVSRPPNVEARLRDAGNSIHLYWLSGYIFFGSSEQLFETVRRSMEKVGPSPIRHIILDMTRVPGTDASARASFAKLVAYCGKRGTQVVFSGLDGAVRRTLERAGTIGRDGGCREFADHALALEWCEEQVLSTLFEADASDPDLRFRGWLAGQLGSMAEADRLRSYLVRLELASGDVVYRAGEAADSMDFIAAGLIDVTIPSDAGRALVRRMARETIVGEMGFFRKAVRNADVTAANSAVLFCLRRPEFERLERELPHVALAVARLVIRELSNRLELANREAGALR